MKWQYFLFLRTTPYFIYVKGTSSSEKSKNRLIFPARCAVSSTSPGNECKCAGYIPLYLCSLESTIYCILCIGFSPVCLTPKTTALTERVPRGLLKKASVIFYFFFLPLYAVWDRMDDFYGNGKIRLKSGIFLIKTQTKSAKCFVQLSEHQGGGGSKCFFAFQKQMSFLTYCIHKKAVTFLPHGLFTTAHKQGAAVQCREWVAVFNCCIGEQIIKTAEANKADACGRGWINKP